MKGKAENERAFERVFQALYSPLCFFAASIIRDDVEAEDVVQQVFVSLWEKNPELEWSMELKPFLYRSVRNAALNHIRQEEVRRRFYAFLEEQQTEYEDEGEWEEREKMYQKLDEAIAALPEQMREVFLLSRFSGKTSAEIAAQLGLSVRTVENQIYRAMKALREKLDGDSSNDLILLFLFA